MIIKNLTKQSLSEYTINTVHKLYEQHHIRKKMSFNWLLRFMMLIFITLNDDGDDNDNDNHQHHHNCFI